MRHPQIVYLYEPYHFWASIDRRTDVTNLLYTVDGLYMMDESHWSERAQLHFNRLVGSRQRTSAQRVIEKTPHNVSRIGFLEKLAPNARYIHVVRDGIDVARSIDRLATTSSYRSADKPDYNQWWGRDHRKWKALARDGIANGFFPNEVPLLKTHAQMGAYEWLVSLGQVERWHQRLGERLHEIRYADLTSDPAATLHGLCDFFGVDCLKPWRDKVVRMVSSERKNAGEPIALPTQMAEQFNRFSQHYGFEGRAIGS